MWREGLPVKSQHIPGVVDPAVRHQGGQGHVAAHDFASVARRHHVVDCVLCSWPDTVEAAPASSWLRIGMLSRNLGGY